jgi:hypothetical protein
MYGVCIHVFDSADDRECLRFDCFPVGAHYHYLHQDVGTHEFMHHDAAANGPALEWALGAIRNRLAPMLRQAGSAKSAAKITPTEASAAVEQVATVAHEKLQLPTDA